MGFDNPGVLDACIMIIMKVCKTTKFTAFTHVYLVLIEKNLELVIATVRVG